MERYWQAFFSTSLLSVLSVVLVVNTASYWGSTPQYKNLEDLYQKHKSRGFFVLGFPCNQFANEEPDDECAIKGFVTSKFGVTFPMFSKVEVNGPGAHPIFKFLKSKESCGTQEVGWNFEKFLVDGEGKLVKRFGETIKPMSIEKDILALLSW